VERVVVQIEKSNNYSKLKDLMFFLQIINLE